MRNAILLLVTILFFSSPTFAQVQPSTPEQAGLKSEVIVLINQYKELRERRRNLSRGVFDKDIDGFDGRLHRVLGALGSELGHPPYTKAQIISWLGEPDAIRSKQQMRPYLRIHNRELARVDRESESQREQEYLIYFWRGWHDFMFFIVEQGEIVDHGWWFAYE